MAVTKPIAAIGSLKLVVDRDLCEANAVCMRLVPQVFRVDDEDQLHLLEERFDDATDPELMARIERAVNRCPRTALSLEYEHDGE